MLPSDSRYSLKVTPLNGRQRYGVKWFSVLVYVSYRIRTISPRICIIIQFLPSFSVWFFLNPPGPPVTVIIFYPWINWTSSYWYTRSEQEILDFLSAIEWYMDASFPCHSPCIPSLQSLIPGMGKDSETCARLRQLCWWRHHHRCDWCGHLLRFVPRVWCVLGCPCDRWQRATRRNIDSWRPASCGAWGCGTWDSEARGRRTSLPLVAGTVGALSSERWTWGWAASRRHCR